MHNVKLAIAACLSACAVTTNALEIDTLGYDTFFTNGKLTISASGACKGKVTLDNIELHTYNPIEATSATIAAYYGETFVNNYGFVLADPQGNIVAAYAPARRLGTEVISNGITVQKLTGSSDDVKRTFKSTLQLQANQDEIGAIETLMSYLHTNHYGKIVCQQGDFSYSPLNESASTFSLTDSTNDTASKYSYKTQFKAKSVAGFVKYSSAGKGSSYTTTAQLLPFTLNVSFAGSGTSVPQ